MKNITLIFFFILTCNHLTSQEITFDFKNKKFTNASSINKIIKDLNKGDFFNIVVDNINLNLYNVSINKKDSIVEFGAEFPSLDLIGMESIIGLFDNLSASIEATETEETAKKSSKNENFISEIENEELKKKKENLKVFIDNKSNVLKSHIKEIKNQTIKINTLFRTINANKILYLHSQYSKSQSLYIDSVYMSFEQALESVSNINKKIDSLKKEIKQDKSSYEAYKDLENNFDVIEKTPILKQKNETLLKSYESSINEIDSIKKKIEIEKIIEIYTDIIHLENNSKRKYTSMPLQKNGDITEFTIEITPKKEEYNLQSFEETFTFPVNHFYVGIGGGFYGASFNNESYSSIESILTDSTSNFSIVAEDTSNFELGFVSLLHIGWKIPPETFKNYLGAHVSLGPAISFASTPQFRAALGGGISIGKSKNMFSIDALAMFGNVNTLSNSIDLNKTYSTLPESLTVPKIKASFALSFGYIYNF